METTEEQTRRERQLGFSLSLIMLYFIIITSLSSITSWLQPPLPLLLPVFLPLPQVHSFLPAAQLA